MRRYAVTAFSPGVLDNREADGAVWHLPDTFQHLCTFMTRFAFSRLQDDA
jgi:hypothetical protein